jgi:hypothetical protein
MKASADILKSIRNMKTHEVLNSSALFYGSGFLVFGIVFSPFINWERYYDIKTWLGKEPAKQANSK